MALYFVDYDLRHEDEHDYDELYEALEAHGAIRMLQSSWCLERDGTTCKTLREHFWKFMHKQDGIVVSKVDDWSTRGAKASPNDLDE